MPQLSTLSTGARRALALTLNVILFLVVGTLTATTAHAQNPRAVAVNGWDLAYSPLTKRLYASVPTGNSLVTIDPVSGTVIGSPLIIGSQPRKLAISDNGEYLYVGFFGASFVKRVHLPTHTVDLEFALPVDPFFGALFVEDMEVMPGNPDVVAISLFRKSVSPRHGGVAIFDRGARRASMTRDHTGSNVIAFASAGVLYGYNTETTDFGLRTMAVTPSGVTETNVARGLVSGFNRDIKYADGLVYSTGGTIADPVNSTVRGEFLLGDYNYAATLETHPDAGIVFFAARSFQSSSGWVLRTFSTFTQLELVNRPLPGVSGDKSGTLIRWGGNGLALALNNGVVWLLEDGLPPRQEPESPLDPQPSLEITTPTTDPEWTGTPGVITLAGIANDPVGMPTQIAWTSDRGGSGTIAGATTWTLADLPVQPGRNTFTVTMTGASGKSAGDVISVDASTDRTYVLAEGATGAFFDLDLALANPNAVAAPVTITWLRAGGSTVTQDLTLAAQSRTTIRVDEVPGLEATTMSTIVRSNAGHPLVVERTMRWDGVGQYGSHTDKANDGPATTWYFAEGATGFFATYLLLANPNDTANVATVDWLREGEAPVRRTYPLGPNSRETIDAAADAQLATRSFGIVVRFAIPAVADRSMYFGFPPDQLFKGGHNSAGVNAPSPNWLLAEGATGSFFETFILIANPNAVEAPATVTFLPSSGVPVVRYVKVPANGRRTLNIEALTPAAPTLAADAVATQVQSPLPIVVERAQYWPGGPSTWYEAHNSFGVTAPRRRWGLAEGRVGNPPAFPTAGYQSFVLLANSGLAPATVRLTFLRENGTPIEKSFVVKAQSRRTVQIAGIGSDVPELMNETFGVVIDADQPIAVERAMYGSPNGQLFGSGTNATATALPLLQ